MATILDELLVRIGPQFIGKGELRKLESAVGRVQAKLNGLATGFAKVGTVLTAGLAATVKPFATVERKFAEVEGLVGVSRDQLNAWEPELNRIGRAYGQVPEKMADALFFLTSAGLEGDKVLQALEGSAKGSAAGLGEIETIANLVTGAMEVMGIGAAEALDIVTATIREGKLDPASLTGPLGQVLPLAGELGASFDQVGGIMAVLSRRNFDAARGATALRGIFSKLIKPTEAGKKELAKYGLTIAGLREELESKGLLSVLEKLNTVFTGDSEGLGKVFEDIEGLAGFLAIFSGDIADVRDILDSTRDSAGDLDKALAPIKNTISFRWDQALAGGLQVLTDLGERSKDFINDLFDLGEKAIDTYLSLSDAQKELIAQVLTWGPALLGFAAGLKGVSIVLGWLEPAADAISWFIKKTGIATAAQALWNWVIGAGTAAYAAVQGAAASTFAFIRGLTLTGLWTSIQAGGIAAFATVKGAAVSAFATIRGLTLASLWTGIKVAGGAAFSALGAAGVAAWTVIKLAALAAWTVMTGGTIWIVIGIIAALAAAAALLVAAWKPVSSFFRGMWDGVAEGGGRVAEAFGRLLDALGPVGEGIRATGRGIVGAFRWMGDRIGAVWDWIVNMFGDQSDVGRGWGDAIIDGAVAVIDAITAVVEWLKSFGGLSLSEAGAKLMMTLVNGIKATAGMAKDAVLSALSGIRDLLPFSDARVGPLSRLTQSGRAIVTTIAEGVQSAPASLTDALREALPGLPTLAISGLPSMPDLGLPDMPTLRAALPSLPDLGLPPLPELRAALPDMPSLDIPSLDALAPPLPIGPVPPPAAAGATSLTVTLGEGAIQINAPGGDAEQIAERIGGELQNQWRALAEQVDSRLKA